MQQSIPWLWLVGVFGFSAVALAQTPAQPPVSAYDGTYAFVSATKVNETYAVTGTNRIVQCTDRRVGPLTIVNGQARYSYNRQCGHELEGTVGSQGELAMRLATPGRTASSWFEVITHGRIDGNGTVSARQINNRCNYDLIWRKKSK
jgi:hypothetical protein